MPCKFSGEGDRQTHSLLLFLLSVDLCLWCSLFCLLCSYTPQYALLDVITFGSRKHFRHCHSHRYVCSSIVWNRSRMFTVIRQLFFCTPSHAERVKAEGRFVQSRLSFRVFFLKTSVETSLLMVRRSLCKQGAPSKSTELIRHRFNDQQEEGWHTWQGAQGGRT